MFVIVGYDEDDADYGRTLHKVLQKVEKKI